MGTIVPVYDVRIHCILSVFRVDECPEARVGLRAEDVLVGLNAHLVED